MKYTLSNANKYIEKNKDKINKQYRLKYHMSCPVGWMNDPNGLVYFNGEYHLFYQYYPYDSKWGPMHWGHFVSKDLVKYKDVNVALAPNNKYFGCFSGGAIVINNRLNLVYTAHIEKPNEPKKELVALASSSNGLTFRKKGIIFDNNLLPKENAIDDFRDPNPVYINGKYYVFVGNRISNKGVITVLEGDKIDELKYSFTIGPFYELGDMGECPSLHKVGNYDVIVASGCHVPSKGNSFKNCNSSVFIIGKIDFENKKMDVINIHECDKGDTFYAPQFIQNIDEPIIVGWLEMWGKQIPTQELNHGYAGALSIPRQLFIKDNKVYQKPISLEKYYSKSDSNNIAKVSHIDSYIKGDFKLRFIADNGEFTIQGNKESVSLDTTKTNSLSPSIRSTDHGYKEVRLEILLDISSIELFVNDGEYVISSRIYLDGNYKLEKEGQVILEINNLII